MKSAIFFAGLMVGTAAVAHAAQPSGRTVADQSQSSGPQGLTQQGTDPEGQACTPPGYNQGTTGYPPCGGMQAGGTTAGGTQTTGTGAGGTQPTGTAAGGMQTTGTGAGGTAPPCSRTVTDGCLQTYERGMRPRR